MKKLLSILLITLCISGNAQSTLDSYTNSARFLSNDFLQTYQGARISVPTMTLPNSLTTYTSTNPFQNNDILQVYNAVRGMGDAVSGFTNSCWSVNGNSVTAGLLGTTGDQPFSFITNGISRGGFGAAGNFSVGTGSFGSSALHIARFTKNTATVDIGAAGAGLAAIWLNANTPSASNYALYDDASSTYLNGKSGNSVYLSIGANNVQRILLTANQILNPTKIGALTNPSATLDVAGTGAFSQSVTTAGLLNTGTLSSTSATITGGLLYGTTNANFLMLDNSIGSKLAYNANNQIAVGNTTGAMLLNGGNIQTWNASGSAITGTLSTSSNATVTGRLLITDNTSTTSLVGPYDLEINKNINGGVEGYFRNSNAGTAAYSNLGVRANSTQQTKMGILSSGFTTAGLFIPNTSYVLSVAADQMLIGNQTTLKPIIFINGGTTASDEVLRINESKNILIGTTTDTPSAKLKVESTTQGVLFPRMTTAQKNAIASPVAGLVVYDTTLNKLCVYTTVWETVTSL